VLPDVFSISRAPVLGRRSLRSLDRFAEFVLAYGDHCTRYEKPQAIFPCRAPARPSNKENPQFVKRMVRAIVRGVIHSRDFPEDSFKP